MTKAKVEKVHIPGIKPRNPFGTSVVMTRGGSHAKSVKEQRVKEKAALKKAVLTSSEPEL